MTDRQTPENSTWQVSKGFIESQAKSENRKYRYEFLRWVILAAFAWIAIPDNPLNKFLAQTLLGKPETKYTSPNNRTPFVNPESETNSSINIDKKETLEFITTMLEKCSCENIDQSGDQLRFDYFYESDENWYRADISLDELGHASVDDDGELRLHCLDNLPCLIDYDREADLNEHKRTNVVYSACASERLARAFNHLISFYDKDRPNSLF